MSEEDWIEISSRALCERGTVSFSDHSFVMDVKWLRDLTADELAQIEDILRHAYNSRSMWEIFQANYEAGQDMLVFNLRDRDEAGRIVATRSAGDVPWGNESWRDIASLCGVDVIAGGASLSVARGYRDRRLGGLIWQVSTDWLREHSGLPALFGSSISRHAVAMYKKRGAYFVADDVRAACDFYEAVHFDDFLGKTADLECFERDCSLRYVWPFTAGVEGRVKNNPAFVNNPV